MPMTTHTLKVRELPYELPSYSLTGDILGYLRCGLQYRYSRLGKMPSRSPVQLWFGNFIHGCMDEGFRTYHREILAGADHPTALSRVDPERVIQTIEARLEAQGLEAWEPWTKVLGYARARVALSDLADLLFPLISQSEVRLTGARPLATLPPSDLFRRADRYEMAGVIDVVSHIEMSRPEVASNPVVQKVRGTLGKLPANFEIIIDYKGSRRPPKPATAPKKGAAPSLWDQYNWQILTYSDLRQRQPGSHQAIAGFVIYLNELLPLETDLEKLEDDLKAPGLVVDEPVSSADLSAWRKKARATERTARATLNAGGKGSELLASKDLVASPVPWAVRLRRALRLVPVFQKDLEGANQQFDQVVYQIECCRGREFHKGQILGVWTMNPSDHQTCAPCDVRTWCPSFAAKWNHGRKGAPELPRKKV